MRSTPNDSSARSPRHRFSR